MNVKKVMLLVGALVIAVITAVMAKNMFTGAGAAQAEASQVPTGPKILVARKALPVGTIIDQESLTYQAWPKELVQNAYYIEGAPESDMSKLLGTVVRNAITAGQPVTQGSLVGPNDRGFLAAALGPGMRAVTVPVTTTSGVAGFVFPGDRVDLVLTQEVTGGGDGPALKVSETIVRNLRVLATDQRIDSKDEEGNTVVKTFSMVTVEATPRLAEKIAVSQSLGTLSLALRSIADNTAAKRQPGRRTAPAAGSRQSSARHQHDFHNRRRRLALPAHQRAAARRPAARRGRCAGNAGRAGWPGRPRRPRQCRHRSSGGSPLR